MVESNRAQKLRKYFLAIYLSWKPEESKKVSRRHLAIYLGNRELEDSIGKTSGKIYGYVRK